MSELLNIKQITKHIFTIRGHRIMLDRDLAELYGVETRALKQATKRNEDRFPTDFMFILSRQEMLEMVSQTVIPSLSYFGGALPMAFTEQGVAMLSSVLRSEQAVRVNIQIMRAFVSMRQLLATSQVMEKKIEDIERKLLKQGKTVEEQSNQIKMIFSAIKQLLFDNENKPPKRRIGFGNN